MRNCPPCKGTGKRWGIHPEPCRLCRGEGKIINPKPGQVCCHWCGGNGRKLGIHPEFCSYCEGRGYRFPQFEAADPETGPTAIFVEAGKPRTAHVALEPILSSLEGVIRICDPYYGTGTLLRLDSIATKPIRLLTRQPDSNEGKTGVLQRAVQEFTKEHPNVEFKRHTSSDLHDRFVVCHEELILLGHGLKDIGNKESFIVRLSRDIAADTIDEVLISFDHKWANAEVL